MVHINTRVFDLDTYKRVMSVSCESSRVARVKPNHEFLFSRILEILRDLPNTRHLHEFAVVTWLVIVHRALEA